MAYCSFETEISYSPSSFACNLFVYNRTKNMESPAYIDLTRSSSPINSRNVVPSIKFCPNTETVDLSMIITTPTKTKTPPCLHAENIIHAPTHLHSHSVYFDLSDQEDSRNPDNVDSNRLVAPPHILDDSEYTQSALFSHLDDSSEPDHDVEHLNTSVEKNTDDGDNVENETEDERRIREEEESEALARQFMAEEAMASYQQSAGFLRDNASDYNEEDLAALQAIMAEDAATGEDQYENEGSDAGVIDSSEELSYEHLLRLGEEIGDVKTDRWVMRAREEIDKLPIVILNEEIILRKKDGNDCCGKCLICQFPYESGEKTRVLPCGHFFHCDCVDQWLLNKDFCPYCRQSIVKD